MNAADRRRLTPTLGVVAAVLVLILIALWLGLGRAAHWHDNAAPPKLPPLGSTLPPPTVPALDHYAAVWQRPLFSPTRTPEAAAGGGGAASGDLELTGVILLPNLKLAILHDKTQDKNYRVILGQPSRDAPALVELHPRSAVVDAAGSRLSLQLIPGPAPDAANAQAGDDVQRPTANAGQGASVIVSGQGSDASGQRSTTSAGQASAAARARQLKARIQAARRRAEQQSGGGN